MRRSMMDAYMYSSLIAAEDLTSKITPRSVRVLATVGDSILYTTQSSIPSHKSPLESKLNTPIRQCTRHKISCQHHLTSPPNITGKSHISPEPTSLRLTRDKPATSASNLVNHKLSFNFVKQVSCKRHIRWRSRTHARRSP
jgi:hypothetical protein